MSIVITLILIMVIMLTLAFSFMTFALRRTIKLLNNRITILCHAMKLYLDLMDLIPGMCDEIIKDNFKEILVEFKVQEILQERKNSAKVNIKESKSQDNISEEGKKRNKYKKPSRKST